MRRWCAVLACSLTVLAVYILLHKRPEDTTGVPKAFRKGLEDVVLIP